VASLQDGFGPTSRVYVVRRNLMSKVHDAVDHVGEFSVRNQQLCI